MKIYVASVEYIEAIFDTVSVTIATWRQHKICLFFHKIVYILKKFGDLSFLFHISLGSEDLHLLSKFNEIL